MVRHALTPQERERGRRLGTLLRSARGDLSQAVVAQRSGLPKETLRKIEAGRIAGPSFFTVAAIATALGVSLDRIVDLCPLSTPDGTPPQAPWTWLGEPPVRRGAAR